jgi:hypothetical protein
LCTVLAENLRLARLDLSRTALFLGVSGVTIHDNPPPACADIRIVEPDDRKDPLAVNGFSSAMPDPGQDVSESNGPTHQQ